MSKKGKLKIEPGSPAAEFALQGALGVFSQQLASIDETGASTSQALEEAGLLKLFSTDPTHLTPQQIELITAAANGIQEYTRKLVITQQTAELMVNLVSGKKESK